ncbi:MAG: hypothetical protein Q8R76_03940 [Candidatus Omnitrophota bacterium]|nr:hypothetical protein [Candidatus Omnitrophota bacterium]
MGLILKWLGLFAAVVALTLVGFALYGNFLVDYSLENLEMTLSVRDKGSAQASTVGNRVYQKIVEDMALEEAAKPDMDFKSLALLDLASRSLENTLVDAGHERAKLYLTQTAQAKLAKRPLVLRILDGIYDQVQSWQRSVMKLITYLQNRLLGRTAGDKDTTYEASSLLLLSYAEEKEEKWQLEEAAELYRRFLKFYPGHGEVGFVQLSLAHNLIKQKKYREAELILRRLQLFYPGTEQAELATHLRRKIGHFRKRDEQIRELEELLPLHEGTLEGEQLKLKLGLQYLYGHSLDKAQETLKQLENASDSGIRQRAKFYIGWIYKLQSQFDQGAKIMLELMEQEDLGSEFSLGLNAQLADIYHQKNDPATAVDFYRELSQKADAGSGQAWAVMAAAEQAGIQAGSLNNSAEAEANLKRLQELLPGYEGQDGLRNALRVFEGDNSRDNGFIDLKAGRLREALDLFKQRLNDKPSDAWANSGLALAYLMLTDLGQARHYAEEGYRLRGDDFTASVLGYVLGYTGHVDESMALFYTALAKNPSYIPARFNLAYMLIVRKKYEQALEHLRVLEKRLESRGDILYAKVLNNMGLTMWWLGDREQAVRQFERALEVKPGFADAVRNLEQIGQGIGAQVASGGTNAQL